MHEHQQLNALKGQGEAMIRCVLYQNCFIVA